MKEGKKERGREGGRGGRREGGRKSPRQDIKCLIPEHHILVILSKLPNLDGHYTQTSSATQTFILEDLTSSY